LTFSYDSGKPLISNFNLAVGTRDRICIIGKNGKGKTTLLKLMAGVLTPREGNIIYHPTVTRGFFEQNQVQGLVDTRTVVDEIQYSNPDVDPQTARNISGAIMFEGDDALKKIQVLSGGEKSRVILGKLLVTPVSLLLLDEPTNHLDMESSDAMLAAIDNFDGTVILVTHNEMFLHAIAKRLIVFQNDYIEIFEGTYQDFLDRTGWQEDDTLAVRSGNRTGGAKRTKKEIKRLRSEFMNERIRILGPIKDKINKTEKIIEESEKKLGSLTRAMQGAVEKKESARIQNLSKEIFKCQADIDHLFDELEKITEDFEEKSAHFDEQLQLLEDQWR